MTEITLDEQSAKLEDYEKGFLAVHLVNTGVVLGLFDKLSASEGGLGPDTLASELGLHEPYVRLWCQSAYYFEILDCAEDGRFKLAPHMGSLLTDPENPYYFGHRARFMVSHWANLLKSHPEYYRSGDTHFWDALGYEFSKDAKALTSHLVPLAYRFMIIPSIPELKERLDAGIKVLDVGCGGGDLMIQLAKDFPRCSFVGTEIDRFVIEDTRRHLEDNGVEDRTSVTLVDAASMEYDGEFDLVNMAVVLHEIRPNTRYRSIANCYKALKDGGEIVIFDFAFPDRVEDFRKPEYAPSIKDQFYEITWGTEHLPSSERHQLLAEFGFKDVITNPIFGGAVEVTYAKK
jgi:ubiquinone/menaquinone biosynthesis C-methylase UbiE